MDRPHERNVKRRGKALASQTSADAMTELSSAQQADKETHCVSVQTDPVFVLSEDEFSLMSMGTESEEHANLSLDQLIKRDDWVRSTFVRHQCQICGAAFVDSSQLKLHSWVHQMSLPKSLRKKDLQRGLVRKKTLEQEKENNSEETTREMDWSEDVCESVVSGSPLVQLETDERREVLASLTQQKPEKTQSLLKARGVQESTQKLEKTQSLLKARGVQDSTQSNLKARGVQDSTQSNLKARGVQESTQSNLKARGVQDSTQNLLKKKLSRRSAKTQNVLEVRAFEGPTPSRPKVRVLEGPAQTPLKTTALERSSPKAFKVITLGGPMQSLLTPKSVGGSTLSLLQPKIAVVDGGFLKTSAVDGSEQRSTQSPLKLPAFEVSTKRPSTSTGPGRSTQVPLVLTAVGGSLQSLLQPKVTVVKESLLKRSAVAGSKQGTAVTPSVGVSQQSKKAHVRGPSSIKTCPVCDAKFGTQDTMKTHLSSHLFYDIQRGEILLRNADVHNKKTGPGHEGMESAKTFISDGDLNKRDGNHSQTDSNQNETADDHSRSQTSNDHNRTDHNHSQTTTDSDHAQTDEAGEGNKPVPFSHSCVTPSEFSYKCLGCSISFLRKKDLFDHRDVEHFNVKCEYYGRTLLLKEARENPFRDNKSCVCESCGINFNSPFDLQIHISQQHSEEKTVQPQSEPGRKSVRCELCQADFSSPFILRRHMMRHARDEGGANISWTRPTHQAYVCEVCGAKIKNANYVKIHMALHTGEKVHKCGLCNAKFSKSHQLNSHRRKHHQDEKSFMCKLCPAAYCRSQDLNKHHYNEHVRTKKDTEIDTKFVGPMGKGRKVFICKYCGKTFSMKKTLQYHYNVHTGERPFTCTVCSKSFSFPASLKIHKCSNKKDSQKSHVEYSKHKRNERVQCQYCLKSFSNKFILTQHIRLHTGEGLLICEVCGKGFAYLAAFNTHRRIHTGEKPYECDVCHKRFSRNFYLRVHYRIHTGEKPYPCGICGRKFRQQGDRAAHQRRHGRQDIQGVPEEQTISVISEALKTAVLPEPSTTNTAENRTATWVINIV